MRLNSFLEKLGLELEGEMISFTTYKKDLKNDAGFRRIAKCINAVDGKLTLTIDAPEAAAHRFGPQLERIIDVISIEQRDGE